MKAIRCGRWPGSWTLTKGNSIRLFFFYLLLLVAFIIVSTVISLVLGLVFALAGEQAQFGQGIVSGLTNAVMIVVAICVLAAVHTQFMRLAGGPTEPTDA